MMCCHVFEDLAGRFCAMDVIINHVTSFYAPNDQAEWPDLFWWIDPHLMTSHRVILADDWNAAIHPDIQGA